MDLQRVGQHPEVGQLTVADVCTSGSITMPATRSRSSRTSRQPCGRIWDGRNSSLNSLESSESPRDASTCKGGPGQPVAQRPAERFLGKSPGSNRALKAITAEPST